MGRVLPSYGLPDPVGSDESGGISLPIGAGRAACEVGRGGDHPSGAKEVIPPLGVGHAAETGELPSRYPGCYQRDPSRLER